MRDQDLKPFAELLDSVCSLLSRGAYQPSATNTALWFRALRAYPLEVVQGALDAHVMDPQRGRFVPTPADILAQIAERVADDGRPGAEEAWAIALSSVDEARTIVWTAEAAEAWRIARPVLDHGDEVGARMAFREAYARLVEQARKSRVSVAWRASLGFDAEQRVAAIEGAVQIGRLPRAELLALPAPAEPEGMSADVRQTLRALAEALRNRRLQPSRDAEAMEKTGRLQEATARRVRAYMDAHRDAG